jgi:hypothetical protein
MPLKEKLEAKKRIILIERKMVANEKEAFE